MSKWADIIPTYSPEDGDYVDHPGVSVEALEHFAMHGRPGDRMIYAAEPSRKCFEPQQLFASGHERYGRIKRFKGGVRTENGVPGWVFIAVRMGDDAASAHGE